MATEVIVTVKPSGGDYTGLIAAEAGEQRDLAALDEQATIECFAFQDNLGTTTLDFNGWETGELTFIKITVPTAERHDGKFNTDKFYILFSGGSDAVRLTETYMTLEGLQLQMSAFNSFRHGFKNNLSNARHTLRECIVKNGRLDLRNTGFNANSTMSAGFVNWINCIAYDFTFTSLSSNGFLQNSAGIDFVRAYNCTAINCSSGYSSGNSRMRVRNCVAFGCDTGFNIGTPPNSTNNASDDDTHPATNGVSLNGIEGTDIFSDFNNDDFHLMAGSALLNVGKDLSSDPEFAFNTDIDGDMRVAPWDIGVDEIITIDFVDFVFGEMTQSSLASTTMTQPRLSGVDLAQSTLADVALVS